MGAIISYILPTKCGSSRRVETAYGPVIGKRYRIAGDRDVDAFLGIPFAKPPIGELRFQVLNLRRDQRSGGFLFVEAATAESLD